MLVDKFFENTFNLEKEKQEVIDFIQMKKNQNSAEAVFYDKYYEIQDCIGEQFKISKLKSKLWNGTDISKIVPRALQVETKEQLDDWRYLIRFTSSFKNVSNPGRNMKFLVEDETSGKYLGALTVTSDFGDLGARDRYIGWTRDDRYKNKKLNNVACGQAIIPIQPFGHNFLGGKLMALMITSDTIRNAWEEKYGDILVGMTTTSLYGTHSQYNSMPTFKKRGKTTGKMPIKLPKKMIRVWEEYFDEKRKVRSNLDSKIYRECGMKPADYVSGIQRGIYFCSFYENTNKFLCGNIKKSSLKIRQGFVNYNNYITDWWKPKAERRFNKLQSEDRLINKLHFWDKLFGLSYEEAKQNYLGEVGR
jgi:hypothetical protein